MKFKPKLECSTVGKQTQITNETPNLYLIKLSNVKIYQALDKPKSTYIKSVLSLLSFSVFSLMRTHEFLSKCPCYFAEKGSNVENKLAELMQGTRRIMNRSIYVMYNTCRRRC